MAGKNDLNTSSFMTNFSDAERRLLRERFLREFPEFLELKSQKGSPYYKDLFEKGIDDLLESLYMNPSVYYELRSMLRPQEIIDLPEAYRKDKRYEYVRDIILPQCQEELKGGLPTGVFNFDEMKSYNLHDDPDHACCQEPCGLFLISCTGMFSSDDEAVRDLDPPLETNFRLVIDDENGIDLVIRSELYEEISPTFSSLHLVEPGVVQLTLKTVVFDTDELVQKELESPEGPSRALQAAINRGSYFMHATLYKRDDEWLIVPGMTRKALVMNDRFMREHNLFDRAEPSAQHVPFIRELFDGIMT